MIPTVQNVLKPVAYGFLCASLVLAVSGWALLHIDHGRVSAFDESVRTAVHSVAVPPLTVVMQIVTWLGSVPVLAGLGILLSVVLYRRGFSDQTPFPLAAALSAEILTEITKWIVRRPRPPAWFDLHASEPWSFPSGHSLDSTVCCLVFGAALLSMLRSRRAYMAVIVSAVALPLLIGFSRVYLGMHWPTDVVASWIAGASLAAGLIRARAIPAYFGSRIRRAHSST